MAILSYRFIKIFISTMFVMCCLIIVSCNHVNAHDATSRATARNINSLGADISNGFNGCTFTSYSDQDTGLGNWKIQQHGCTLFSENGLNFSLVSADDISQPLRELEYRHLTGSTDFNFLVGEWDGAAHGGFNIELFVMGADVRKIAQIESVIDGKFVSFPDRQECRFVTHDQLWEYWRGCSFAYSPLPVVILKRVNTKYCFDRELMKKRAPTEAQLKVIIERARGEIDGISKHKQDDLSLLLVAMLDQIYAGNLESAWKILDGGWSGSADSKVELKEDLFSTLCKSKYWPDIKYLLEEKK